MRICIVGLGAIGGLLGARLAAAGHEVSAIARGATLEAVRRDGLRLIEATPGGGAPRESAWPITVADDPAALPTPELVVVAVKTTGLAAVAPAVGALVTRGAHVLSTMNGVPWWFFHGLAPEHGAIRLTSIDPTGAIAASIPAASVLGTVTHLSASTAAPGVVRHGAGMKIIVGEPSGGAQSARCRATIDALASAGFEVVPSQRIQQDVWFKLWGNMTMNPVSGITGATGDRILDDDLVRGFLSACMREASAIGAKIGLPIDVDPEDRHAVTRKLGAFRTSMLQDVEAGRPVELDALVAAVAEIGRQVGVATPSIDTLFGLARLHARVRGLYPLA